MVSMGPPTWLPGFPSSLAGTACECTASVLRQETCPGSPVRRTAHWLTCDAKNDLAMRVPEYCQLSVAQAQVYEMRKGALTGFDHVIVA